MEENFTFEIPVVLSLLNMYHATRPFLEIVVLHFLFKSERKLASILSNLFNFFLLAQR